MRSDLAVRVRARAAGRASAVVYVLIFVTAVAQTAIVPLLPEVQRSYGLDASSLAWILTLPSLAMLATATPIGILGDRIGNRRVTIFAGVVIALAVFVQGIPTLGTLILARLAFGIGYGALWTAGLAWLAGMGSGSSARRMGATVTASAAGSTLGPVLAGVLASHFGFSAPFAVTGAVATVVAGLLVAAPDSEPAPEPARPVAAADALPPAPRRAPSPRWRYSFGGSTLALLRRPAVLAGAATLALSGGVASLLQLLVPLQLHASGHSAQQIGLVLSGGALVFIGASAVCVHLGPRITNRRLNAWLPGLLAVALVPALVGPGLAWVVGAVVLTVVPRSAINTVSYALATDDREPGGPGRGAVIGVLNSLWAVATVLVPVVAGAVSAVAGYRVAYAGAVVVALAVCVGLRRGLRRQPATRPPVAAREQVVPSSRRDLAPRPPVTRRPPASRPAASYGRHPVGAGARVAPVAP